MSPNNIDNLQLVGVGLERWPGLHWNSGRFSTGIGGLATGIGSSVSETLRQAILAAIQLRVLARGKL